MVDTRDLQLRDGRVLRVYDSAGGEGGGTGTGRGTGTGTGTARGTGTGTGTGTARGTLLWHHGSPQTGALLAPVLAAASARGLRLVSFGRAGYGGSSAQLGRTVAAVASDVEQLLDALGIAQCAVMGASGGGPHALACAAALPDRVSAAVTLAGVAPFEVDVASQADWFAGMADDSGLRAALLGRDERARHEETAEFDPTSFVDRDYAALEGPWACLGDDVEAAGEFGMGGLIDDDWAFVRPWGVDLATIVAPVLVVQGGRDRVIPQSHAERLLRAIPRAELWLRPQDGHVSVLGACPVAMDWISDVSAPA